MPTDARQRMVAAAARLLATVGLQGFSIGALIKASGAPRGSVYHHFPGGKDQIISEALRFIDQQAMTRLAEAAHVSPETVIAAFLQPWHDLLTGAGFRAGCGVLAVASAADSPGLIAETATIFTGWQATLAAALGQAGVDAPGADSFATLAIAAVEGAVVLSRARRSLQPFDQVADLLLSQASSLGRA